ncbi:MAG: XdhC family protein, partial [Deltaproteobacteria bacterium]|nr:XdhC family protein [Deltaproteobacteria bacterium]
MDLLARAAELLSGGETFCLATVVEGAEPGRKALVHRNGSLEGGLGSPDL